MCECVRESLFIKTVQARITKSSQWATSRSLIFRDKISCSHIHAPIYMQKTCCIALCSTKTDGVSADIIGGGALKLQ